MPTEEEQLETLIEFVQPYFDRFGYAIVFVATLLENSAFVGAAIPGDVVLLLAGFYAERGRLDLPPIMALAFVGALLGDSAGYMIGRVGGRRLVQRFGDRVFLPAHRIARVERYFQEYGLWAVAVGRFAPGIRTVNTFAAGMSRMPYLRFLVAVAAASLVWAIVVPILGFVFAGSLAYVKSSIGWAGVIVLVLFAAGVFLTYRRMMKRLEREDLTLRRDRRVEPT